MAINIVNSDISFDIKNKIEQCEVVSFDVFDTLLVRPYARPVDLFFHLEKIYNVPGFALKRINAERCARKVYCGVQDVTIEQIYENFDESSFSHMLEKELELEYRVLTCKPIVKKIYDYAVSLGKKVVIASDMYLSKNFIQSVLLKNGYDKQEKIYVSSEIKLTKYSGNMYEHILKDLGVAADKILHIGDSVRSDVENPKKYGIHSFRVPNDVNLLLEENKAVNLFYKHHKNDLGCSVIVALIARCLYVPKQNYWKYFGYVWAGPVIYSFIKWLDKQFCNDDIKNVFFVARDGYTLQKVFEIIKSSNIHSSYFYAPRIFNTIYNFDYENKIATAEETALKDVRLVLNFYREKDEYLKNNTPNISTFNEGKSFILANINTYKRLAEIEKEDYKEYICNLNEVNLYKCALVDSIGCFLASLELFASVMPECNISGYYWMLDPKVSQKKVNEYLLKSFNPVRKFPKFEWNLMEFIMTSPEMPIVGIKEGKPVYKENISLQDVFRSSVYPDVSDGAVEFAQNMKNTFGEFGIDIKYEVINFYLEIMMKHLNADDTENLSKLQYAVDSEHSCYAPLVEENRKLKIFNILPVKIKKRKGKIKFFLFDFIPIYKIRINMSIEKHYLFGFILIFMRKTKESNVDNN